MSSDELQRIVKSLTDVEREILELCRGGYPTGVIVRLTGTNRSTVKRVKAHLRQLVDLNR